MRLRLSMCLLLSCLSSYIFGQTDRVDSMKIIKNALALRQHADSCLNVGDTYSALKALDKSSEILKNFHRIETDLFIVGNKSLASNVLSRNMKYTDAIKLETEAKEIVSKLLGTQHQDYALHLSRLAEYNNFLGNYGEAVCLESEAVEIFRTVFGTNHIYYAISLSKLADYLSNVGNDTEAVKREIEASEILKIDSLSYATSLSNLAKYNSHLGKYTDAIKLETEAMVIRREKLGTKNSGYASSLSRLADYNYYHGNYDEAIKLGTEAMEIRKIVLGTDHPDYATSLANLANYNHDLGNYSESIRLGTEAANICRMVQGPAHPNYAILLSNLAFYYYTYGNYVEAIDKMCSAVDLDSEIISLSVVGLSLQRIQDYWNKKKLIYTQVLPLFILQKPDNKSISVLYNKSALFAKGILLNIDMERKSQLFESEDTTLFAEYHIIKSNYEIYNKQINKPIAERCIDTDSLREVIQKLDNDFARKMKLFGEYTPNLRLTWGDVQQSLGDNDIAIEFLDFPINRDSVMYLALTLRKDSEVPKMTILFEERQLKEVSDTMYYQCTEMADLVWKPLQSELKGIKNIYFSPSGALHQTGIEYLPGMEGYNLYRLSSTRELVSIRKKRTNNSAVLYGGLNYYADLDTANTTKSLAILNESYKERANVRGLELRGGQEYLKHTKYEVDNIGKELRKANWICLLDTASLGTEESFKSISGKRVGCLHISTHGFYYTREEATNMAYQFMLLNDCMVSAEDKALTRSGLLMSGANHILEGEDLPDNVEDGFLTAKEIADVDLRGLDLVVLSACQTGLGDISQGEGVFGLQRGFKKAGANSILMSLWRVDDEATQILMTQFYKNLVSGQPKRQSLRSAQKYLREYNNGRFNEPKYWAAFILLDGIE